MSDFLKNIKEFIIDLFTPGPVVMSYWTFYKKLTYWKSNRIFPQVYEMPDLIALPQVFWDEIIRIFRETEKDGHERSISVFWADGELAVTSSIKGTINSVQSKGNVSVRYLPSSKPEYAQKEVIVDDKVQSKEYVYYKKIPKRIIVEFLFSLHTHPSHDQDKWLNNDQTRIQTQSFGNIYVGNKKYYSFFSKQDLESLFSANSPVTGLVTDRLYLIVRTTESKDILSQLTDADINLETIEKKLHLVVFHGEFRQKLVRVGLGETKGSAKAEPSN